MMSGDYVNKCRLCGCSELIEVLKLEESPLCDEYLKSKTYQKNYPLGLNVCRSCNFVQLNYVIPPELIYKNYIYMTTSSHGLNNHFKEYAIDVKNILKLKEKKFIVDIGSNDGTLLSFFKQQGHKILGIEPATEIANSANRNEIMTLPIFFDKDSAKKIFKEFGKADLITINNLFANIVDLNTFFEAVEILLNDDGVFVIESSYLFKMIENMVFDFIYHEHLSYLSVTPLNAWLQSKGFKIIYIQNVNTKGGSLRYFITKQSNKIQINFDIKNYIERELSGVELQNKFFSFQNEILRKGDELIKILDTFKGKKIVGYGASATSTTLISQYKLHRYLDYLVDDNNAKFNTYSPGYHIPVLNSQFLFENKPDVIIILAWRYKNQIEKTLKKLNVKKIIPLPNLHIIEN